MVREAHDYCPVFTPSKEEFRQPFCEYISGIYRKHPDVPMFKVKAPRGWKARRKPFPRLETVKINCPIKQLAFGTRGAYRCYFIEQKEMSVLDFKRVASSEDHAPPAKRDQDDDLLERSFWSSVTINPPLYGADTPHSFFDEQLAYGWNLRDLGCLLKQKNVPHVPGVTTPMTYFGMWKSFFSWHVEDADLYSVNYLHFGASKVWYCVSPKDRARFDRMAQSLFPELHKGCSAFLRHKDIMLSPSLLRLYNIHYTQAKQEQGEFIVLNAGAYHAGFNLGFNCAEAVNFATQDWIRVGRGAVVCNCPALRDGVRLDMGLFCPSLAATSSLQSSSSSSSHDSDSTTVHHHGTQTATSTPKRSPELGKGQAGTKRKQLQSKKGDGRSKKPALEPRGKKRSPSAASPASAPSKRPRLPPGSPVSKAGGGSAQKGPLGAVTVSTKSAARARPSARSTPPGLTAAAAAPNAAQLPVAWLQVADGVMMQAHSTGPTLPIVSSGGPASLVPPALPRLKGSAKAEARDDISPGSPAGHNSTRASRAAARAAAAQESSGTPKTAAGAAPRAKSPALSGKQAGSVKQFARAHDGPATGAVAHNPAPGTAGAFSAHPPRSVSALACSAVVEVAPGSPSSPVRPQRRHTADGSDSELASERPEAIVGEDDAGQKFFCLVQRLNRPARSSKHAVLRWLEEGQDGLFRPSKSTWEEKVGALISVRTQYIEGSARKPGGYKLLTLRSRILDTQLVG